MIDDIISEQSLMHSVYRLKYENISKVVFASHLRFSCCRSLVLAMWVEKHQVLPRYKQCWRMPGEDLLVDMTSGRQVGSRRSWSIRLGSAMVYLCTIGRRVGLLTIKDDQSLIMLALEVEREGEGWAC